MVDKIKGRSVTYPQCAVVRCGLKWLRYGRGLRGHTSRGAGRAFKIAMGCSEKSGAADESVRFLTVFDSGGLAINWVGSHTMIGRKYPNAHEINPEMQPQPLELLHHHKSSGIETSQWYSIMCILCNLTLISNGFPSCLDHCLNSLWHMLYQMILPMVLKVISNNDNYLLDNLLRCNMSIFLRNYMLYMHLNILNWIKIKGI